MRPIVCYPLWAAVMIVAVAHLAGQSGGLRTSDTPIVIDKVTPAPAWALAEREMLEAAADGTRLWLERYVKADGSVNVPERWGVTDGPDDIMETVRGWPLVYAMGAPESVAGAYELVWDGHLRQFGRAKIPTVALAKDGIFVKEFPPSFDWEHTGEGLQAFYWHGLGRPNDRTSLARARRFAGFYLNEDPDRTELRSQTQDHQEPVQRQQGTGDETGDTCGLGRRREPQARGTLCHLLDGAGVIAHKGAPQLRPNACARHTTRGHVAVLFHIFG